MEVTQMKKFLSKMLLILALICICNTNVEYADSDFIIPRNDIHIDHNAND